MGLNLKTKAVADTAALHLRDADGDLMYDGDPKDGKAVMLTLFGPGSREHAKADAKRTSKNIERLRRKGKVEVSADEQIAESADFLTSVTAGSENLDYEGLKGAEMYRALYGDREIGFIADQVTEFRADWANFSKGSQTS